jgi:hypothetical protein
MQKLRSIHLYLGCIFAPMLLFFTISGIWQTLGLRSSALNQISTIHTEARLKNGSELSSPALRIFVIIMAASFVVSTLLGVVMAFKHGRSRRAVYCCLAFGVLFPLAVIFISRLRSGNTSMRAQRADSNIQQLALAATNGKFDALDQMNALCQAAAVRPAAISGGDTSRAFRQAFDYLGSRAGQGNDNAVESLQRAIQLDYLQGFAVEGLGKAAGLGNQKALEPLLHPAEFHILPSGTLFALKPAADNGNQKAIEALAAMATDPAFRYGVVDGLQKVAATAGNATAIDALAVVAKGYNDSESRLAMSILETASSNHIARATEVLHQLTGRK